MFQRAVSDLTFTSSLLKVHCHAIQCFYVDFLRSKMAARRPEAAAPANDLQALTALFFSSPVRSFVIDRRRSISESPLQSRSSLGTKLAFEIWSRKLKQTGFPWTMVKNSWNPKQACRAPQIDLELSWSDDRSRLAIFQVQLYISLHSTMYTTIIDRQGTCWARFVWKDAWPPLFFPHNKMAQKITE